MSVLIRGIDMPTKGNQITILVYPDGEAECASLRKSGTAVPVPPHGRLIDADALERELRENADDLREQYPHTLTRTTWFDAYEHFADIIAVEPTIIEAEGEL